MDERKKDDRTIIIKTETGEDQAYKVSEMSDEEKLVYSKIEIISKESTNIKINAQFKLEQNDILQNHYLEILKPLLSKGKEGEKDK